jgi:hypothetical protein
MLGHFPNPQGGTAPSSHFQEANRDVLALARNFELSALEDRVGPPWEIWQFNEIIFFSSVLIQNFGHPAIQLRLLSKHVHDADVCRVHSE